MLLFFSTKLFSLSLFVCLSVSVSVCLSVSLPLSLSCSLYFSGQTKHEMGPRKPVVEKEARNTQRACLSCSNISGRVDDLSQGEREKRAHTHTSLPPPPLAPSLPSPLPPPQSKVALGSPVRHRGQPQRTKRSISLQKSLAAQTSPAVRFYGVKPPAHLLIYLYVATAEVSRVGDLLMWLCKPG